MISGSKQLLKKIDLYASSFQFSWSPKKKGYGSVFGGFLSICTVVAILLVIWNSGSEIIFKNDPKVLSETQKINKRSTFESNQYTFPVGITVEDNLGQRVPIDWTKIILMAGQPIYKKVGNRLENSITPIFLEPCKKEDFPSLDDDSIKILSLNSLLCISGSKFKLSGYWDEEVLVFVMYGILKFTNYTTTN